MDAGVHRFLPVAEVQRLVFGVRVARRILDAGEEQRRVAEEFRERRNETDRAAGTGHDRGLAESFFEGAARGVEERMRAVGLPRIGAADELRGDEGLLELAHQQPGYVAANRAQR